MAFHILRDFKLFLLFLLVLLAFRNKVFELLHLGGLLPFSLVFLYFAGLDFPFFPLLSLFFLPLLLHQPDFDFFGGHRLLRDQALFSLLSEGFDVVFQLFLLDFLLLPIFYLLFPSFYFFNFLQKFGGVRFSLGVGGFDLFFLFLRSVVFDLNDHRRSLGLFSFNPPDPLCIFMRLVGFII